MDWIFKQNVHELHMFLAHKLDKQKLYKPK